MAYKADDLVKLGHLRSLGLCIKAVTDQMQTQIDSLNEFAEAVIGVTSSVIDNIERED